MRRHGTDRIKCLRCNFSSFRSPHIVPFLVSHADTLAPAVADKTDEGRDKNIETKGGSRRVSSVNFVGKYSGKSWAVRTVPGSVAITEIVDRAKRYFGFHTL